MTITTINPPINSSQLTDRSARQLVCDLCRSFYDLGWATGTGGGISIKVEGKIYMAPSAVQKERMSPEDIFVLDSAGNYLQKPSKDLVISACKPLFMHAYRIFDAGAVLHSHSQNAMLA